VPKEYLVYSTRNRASGTMMELYDSGHPENQFDKPEGRWVVLCADHKQHKSYTKQADAYKGMTKPTWCTGCAVMLDEDETVNAAAKEGFEPFKKARVARAKAPAERKSIFSLHKDQTGLGEGQYRFVCPAGMHVFVSDERWPEECSQGHRHDLGSSMAGDDDTEDLGLSDADEEALDAAGYDDLGEAGEDASVDFGTDVLN
jgi:hypothetical protein